MSRIICVVYGLGLNRVPARGRAGRLREPKRLKTEKGAAPDKICWVTTINARNHHGALCLYVMGGGGLVSLTVAVENR